MVKFSVYLNRRVFVMFVQQVPWTESKVDRDAFRDGQQISRELDTTGNDTSSMLNKRDNFMASCLFSCSKWRLYIVQHRKCYSKIVCRFFDCPQESLKR